MVKNIFFKSCVFILGSTLSFVVLLLLFNFTVFNPEYHKNLFSKLHIYTTLERLIYNTQQDILKILEEEISEVDKNTLLYTLEETLTRKKIENHINQSLDELVDYVKYKREGLPDIYIYENLPDDLSPEIKDSIPPIINARTLLSYFNKDEIFYSILGLRLVFFSTVMFQFFTLSIFFLTLLLLLIYSKNFKLLLNHIYGSLLTTSTILLSFCLMILFILLPKMNLILTPARIGTFYPSEILSSYFMHILKQISTYSVIFAGVFLLLAIGIRIFSDKFDKNYVLPKERSLFISVIFAFLIFIISGILHIYNKNKENQFITIYKTVFLNAPTSEIIPAQDSTITSIRILTIEKETSTPVSLVSFEITGISKENSEPLSILGATDETGIFSNEIPLGRFRLYFPRESIPKNYVQPSPYHFYIDSEGTFLITVPLEDQNLSSDQGTIEIMVLDDDNLPLENLELQLIPLSEVSIASNNNSLSFYELSITNQRGIAVFKTSSGEYMVFIKKETLPPNYLEKIPFSVTIPHDETARYTLKLIKEAT